MTERLKLHHIAASGLMICIDDVKIIVDCPAQAENNFNVMSEVQKRELFEPEGIYSNADCMLFTHGHFDHYDYQLAAEYRRNNPKAVVMAPESVFAVGGWTGKELLSKKIKNIRNNEKGVFNIKGVKIHYYRTKHLGMDFENFGFHYSYIIQKDDIAVFISGDAELDKTVTDIIRNTGHMTACFYNPMVLFKSKTRKMLAEIDADNIYIYHLPVEGYDNFYFRNAALKTMEKYKGSLPNVNLLLGEVEDITQ